MSLRIWYPFNGDNKNYGASTASLTSNLTYVDGKIGQCVHIFDLLNLNVNSNIWNVNEHDVSFAGWFKFNKAEIETVLNNYTYNSTYTTPTGTLMGYNDYGGFAISWTSNVMYPTKTFTSLGIHGTIRSPSQVGARTTSTFGITFDEWIHIVLTLNRTTHKLSLYANGTLIESMTLPEFSDVNNIENCYLNRATVWGGNGPSFSIPVYVNDARIYDHCLSPDEVKEISKALVLYYPLGKSDIFSPNLITNMTAGGRTTLNGKYGINAQFTGSDTYAFFNVSPALELNKTYTLSFDVENFPVNAKWNWTLWNNANYLLPTITGNGHYTYTFVPDSSKLPSGYGLSNFLLDDGYSENPSGTVYFKNFKIEVGETESGSWCPHSTDSTYSTSNALKVIDCSGYNRHGTVTASTCPVPVSGSARNSMCYQFDGDNDVIISSVKQGDILSDRKFTISAWTYLTQSANYRGVLGPHVENYKGIVFCQVSSGSNCIYFNIGNGSTWSGFAYSGVPLNEWVYYTMVYNGTGVIVYKNGVKVGENSNVGTLSFCDDPITIGRAYDNSSRYWKGMISDIKVYATALSAEDIAQEYHRYAAIYSNHSFNASDVLEYGNNLLEKTSFDLTRKAWGNNAYGYTQANCSVTLTDDGVRIYRPANLTVSGNGNTMWGGLVLTPYGQNNRDVLFKGHTYIIKWHVKGKSSYAWDGQGWSNLVGWGGGGLVPNPSNVSCQCTPANFNGEMECWYKWTINDDVYKVCTSSYSSFVQGETYLSYAGFKCNGFGYTNTGPMGTDIYISNIRMYDITNDNQKVNIKTSGVLIGNLVEGNFDKVSMLPDGEIYTTEFIETY